MRLKLSVGSEAVDVVLRPTEQVLCNGTTGLLHFGTNDSYQYAFPNMEITGTLTVEGVPYEITGATADTVVREELSNQSLLLIAFILSIEDAVGVSIDLRDASKLLTIGDFVKKVESMLD